MPPRPRLQRPRRRAMVAVLLLAVLAVGAALGYPVAAPALVLAVLLGLVLLERDPGLRGMRRRGLAVAGFLRRRSAALALAAVTALAAAATLVTTAPPDDPLGAAVALSIDGIPGAARPGIQVAVALRAPTPKPWGCGRDVEATVSFSPSPAWLRAHSRVLSGPDVRVAAVAAGVESMRPDPLDFDVSWDRYGRTGRTVVRAGRLRPVRAVRRWSVSVVVRGAWAHRRAVGSCWIRLPALTGAATTAIGHSVRARRFSGSPEIEAVLVGKDQTGNASAGVVSIAGPLVNPTESRPGPRVGDDRWTCADQNRLAEDDCSGWAVVDAAWRQGFRDAMLLLCGVLLSLVVEVWIRAGAPAKSGP